MDRYMMRIREMTQSARILRQALKQMPAGPVLGKVVRNFKPPAGECQIRVESARGDQGWYVLTQDATKVSRADHDRLRDRPFCDRPALRFGSHLGRAPRLGANPVAGRAESRGTQRFFAVARGRRQARV